MTPFLFEVARSGNKDLLFQILENGDDVNPIVRELSLPPAMLRPDPSTEGNVIYSAVGA